MSKFIDFGHQRDRHAEKIFSKTDSQASSELALDMQYNGEEISLKNFREYQL